MDRWERQPRRARPPGELLTPSSVSPSRLPSRTETRPSPLLATTRSAKPSGPSTVNAATGSKPPDATTCSCDGAGRKAGDQGHVTGARVKRRDLEPVPPSKGPAKIGPGVSASGKIVGFTSLKNPSLRLGSSIRSLEPLSVTRMSGMPSRGKIPVEQPNRAHAGRQAGVLART